MLLPTYHHRSLYHPSCSLSLLGLSRVWQPSSVSSPPRISPVTCKRVFGMSLPPFCFYIDSNYTITWPTGYNQACGTGYKGIFTIAHVLCRRVMLRTNPGWETQDTMVFTVIAQSVSLTPGPPPYRFCAYASAVCCSCISLQPPIMPGTPFIFES